MDEDAIEFLSYLNRNRISFAVHKEMLNILLSERNGTIRYEGKPVIVPGRPDWAMLDVLQAFRNYQAAYAAFDKYRSEGGSFQEQDYINKEKVLLCEYLIEKAFRSMAERVTERIKNEILDSNN
jgi:hypothetical protein